MPPYNTRRKSLSLLELGIVLPKRSRAVEQQPSPPETVVEGEEPPVKRSKRAHESQTSHAGSMSPPRTTTVRIKEENPKTISALSPPPSPARDTLNKIDTEGINDDIVVATLQQLERTGNRPHLVKELATVLAGGLHSVERSANPCALISSRLTAYLNRPWPAISPCPLAKDLSSAHPRRLYFFLTTTPRQPIPNVVEPISKISRIISPSLSSTSADEEDHRFTRGRQAMSPSPEVDLSSPEFDEPNPDAPPTPGGSFSNRSSLPLDQPALANPRRATSPQLEHEERDFKQTANQLYEEAQARRSSQLDVNMGDVASVSSPSTDNSSTNLNSNNLDAVAVVVDMVVGASATANADPNPSSVTMSIEPDESEESVARKNTEAAVALFGPVDHLRFPAFYTDPSGDPGHMDFSSPVIQPQSDDHVVVRTHQTPAATRDPRSGKAVEPMALDMAHPLPEPAVAWDDHLQSPENIELDELETMFDAY